MKKLNLLDQSPSFKVNDTGTIIPFNAFEDNQPFSVTADDATPVFRIKNEMGFLKSVNATVAVGGYVFQLNTKDLVGLVPGTYQVELVVTDSKINEELIFPDTGFCSFNITDSAMTVTGTQIPTMSLDSFKNELQQYVENQATNKLQTIESDFQTYVSNLQDSTIKQAQQASKDAQTAITTANEAGSKVDQASSDAQKALNTVNANSSIVTANSTMLQTVSNIMNGIFPGYDLTTEYHSGQITDLNNLPLGIHTINGWVDYMANMTNFPDFAKNTWGTFIVLPIGQPGTKGSWQLYFDGANNIYTRTRTPGNSTFSSWSKMEGVNNPPINNLIVNSDFSNGSYGWNMGNYKVDTTNTFCGYNTVTLTQSGLTSPNYSELGTSNLIPVKKGQKISVGAWVKASDISKDELDGRGATIGINWYTDNHSSRSHWNDYQNVQYFGDHDWVLFKNEGITPTENDNFFNFHMFLSQNGTAQFALPIVVYGDTLPDWVPNPQDSNYRFNQVQQQITMLTQQIAKLQKNS